MDIVQRKMPKTNSRDRMKKWREKMKENPEELRKHLDKERERDRLRRNDIKLKKQESHTVARKLRLKEAERKRQYRMKKKAQMASSSSQNVTADTPLLGSYATPRTLGKAVSKIRRALPPSPTKKDAVIRKIILDNYGKDSSLLAIWKPRRRSSAAHKIPENHKEAVIAFYTRDDVSRQSPGIKDVKTVKDPITGDRVKHQRRFMNMTVKEAHALFLMEMPLIKIKLAKFYELRPPYVSLTSEMPHNVCVCKYHANVNYLVEALSKKVAGFPNNGTKLMEDLACNVESEECMRGFCDECSDVDIRHKLHHYNGEQALSWKKWIDVDGRPKVVETEGTMEDLILELNNLLVRFKAHVYVKRAQSKSFKDAKDSLREDEVVLQVDFAENYAVISQDEIQSAHWSHLQITIFTACAWLSEGRSISFAVVSDVLSHDKHAVFAFLKKIISVLREDVPEINTIKIFSDGAASQFKNRYIVSNICFSEEDFGAKTEWHFFATSHGKGAVDGIGGVVKRNVWSLVKQRKVLINNASDFILAATSTIKNIKILQLLESDIKVNEVMLNDRWNKVIAIQGIQSHHFFKACSLDEVHVGFTSNSTTRKCQVFKWQVDDIYSSSDCEDWTYSDNEPLASLCPKPNKLTCSDIFPGIFLLIEVPHEKSSTRAYKYVGIVQNPPENDELQVLFLKSVGSVNKIFKTNRDDVSFVTIKQVISLLPTPKLNNVRESVFYEFSDPIDVNEQ